MNKKELNNYINENIEKFQEYELIPEHDTRKSFYNKAKVLIYNHIYILKSYNSYVCIIYNNSKELKYYLNDAIDLELLFSNTTLRHIKEFLLQNIKALCLSSYFDGKITKKDIINNEGKNFI